MPILIIRLIDSCGLISNIDQVTERVFRITTIQSIIVVHEVTIENKAHLFVDIFHKIDFSTAILITQVRCRE